MPRSGRTAATTAASPATPGPAAPRSKACTYSESSEVEGEEDGHTALNNGANVDADADEDAGVDADADADVDADAAAELVAMIESDGIGSPGFCAPEVLLSSRYCGYVCLYLSACLLPLALCLTPLPFPSALPPVLPMQIPRRRLLSGVRGPGAPAEAGGVQSAVASAI